MNIQLTSQDYYRYNAPFRQWLFDSKSAQLGDFRTEECKKIFASEFVPNWNLKRLPKEFYLKGPNFKTDFSKKRQPNTNVTVTNKSEIGFSKDEESRLFSHSIHKISKPVQSTESYTQSYKQSRTHEASYMKRKAQDLEELAPKKEGHAKLIEDRRIKGAYTRLERNNPHDLELSDDLLFTGSTSSSSKSSTTDDYSTLLRLEKEKKARREREISERKHEKEQIMQVKIDKYNQREAEVQEMLKKMICKK